MGGGGKWSVTPTKRGGWGAGKVLAMLKGWWGGGRKRFGEGFLLKLKVLAILKGGIAKCFHPLKRGGRAQKVLPCLELGGGLKVSNSSPALSKKQREK